VTTTQIIAVVIAVFAASFVQALAGFGFGLLAMPLMTLAVSPTSAVVVSTLVGVLVSTWQSWFLRADADRPVVKRMAIGAYIGMPLGLVVLNTVSDTALRFALGVAVLVAVVLLALDVQIRASRTSDGVAGFASGVLNTSLSTNGPPLVFVLQARRLDAAAFRATIVAVFALSNVFAVTLFVVTGKVNRDGVVAALLAVPALLAGQLIGFPLRRHLHGERFRTFVLVLLAAAGVSAIVGALR
jgi:uncharacterized membrane protein YfcA